VTAPIDTETPYLGASWTLSPDRTMMCSNPGVGALLWTTTRPHFWFVVTAANRSTTPDQQFAPATRELFCRPNSKKVKGSSATGVTIGGGPPKAARLAVSPKYSSESAGKARMHTCLDQYRANKGGAPDRSRYQHCGAGDSAMRGTRDFGPRRA
jgi:hypothetical protein